MILEIDNILRNIADIRTALLSVRSKAMNEAAALAVVEMEDNVNEMQFTARTLEFELKQGSG